MKLHEIHAEVAAIAPIIGINSDGVVWFTDEATPEQRAAAEAKLAELLPSLDNTP